MNRSPKAKSKRYTVKVDEKTYKLLQTYSDKTRVPISEAVGEALAEWLIVVAATRVEALQRSAKVISIDADVPKTESIHEAYVVS